MQEELYFLVRWINRLYVQENRSEGAARFSFYEAQSALGFVISLSRLDI
jgi:hypothetical protein